MQLLRGRTTGISALAISPDSRWVVAGSREIVHVWDMFDPDAEPRRVTSNDLEHFYFASDHCLFLDTGSVWVFYDPSTGESVEVTASEYRSIGAVSPNARFALGRLGRNDYACWRLGGAGEAFRRELIWSWPDCNMVYETVFSPGGESFLMVGAATSDFTADDTLAVGIYRTIDGHKLATFQPDSNRFQPVRFTRDGCNVLTVRSKRVLSWDVKKGGQHQTIVVNPTKRGFRDIAIHPGGAILAGLSNGDVVSLFDMTSGDVLRSYNWRIGKLDCVAFTPDGTRCVVGDSRGKVLLFDVE